MRAAGSSVGSWAMVSNQPLEREGTPGGADSSMRHNNFMNFDKELDARGLNCPLPILRTKKALTDLRSGQVLKVLATDPGAVKDFQTFSRQTGHELLSHGEANKEFTFFMRKK
jgi:tRNA 2-thiouridine synthesizing protein A